MVITIRSRVVSIRYGATTYLDYFVPILSLSLSLFYPSVVASDRFVRSDLGVLPPSSSLLPSFSPDVSYRIYSSLFTCRFVLVLLPPSSFLRPLPTSVVLAFYFSRKTTDEPSLNSVQHSLLPCGITIALVVYDSIDRRLCCWVLVVFVCRVSFLCHRRPIHTFAFFLP